MINLLRRIDAAVPNWPGLKKLPEDGLDQRGQEDRRIRRMIISLVGLVSLILIPVVIWLDFWLMPGCLRDSLSHYAYSPFAGSVFTTGMGGVGLLFMIYRTGMRRDRIAAIVAAIGALMIALFSTAGAGFAGHETCDVVIPVTLDFATTSTVKVVRVVNQGAGFAPFTGSEVYHYIGVFLLFAAMIFYCLFSFRLDEAADRKNGVLKPAKVKRNAIYLACGTVLLVCGIAIGLMFFGYLPGWLLDNWQHWDLTLWIEWASFVALSVAALVKGRVFNRVLRSSDDMAQVLRN